MKSYEEIKKELDARRSNTRGLNRAFYEIFSHDMETARAGVAEAAALDVAFSVSDFWEQSETHKTYFYKHNPGAYCEMLKIIEKMKGAATVKTALYYIVTGNAAGQVLIFESYEAAEAWSKAATRWTPEEIAQNIKSAPAGARGFYSIFPA